MGPKEGEHQLSEEDITKAEEMMDPVQKKMTDMREQNDAGELSPCYEKFINPSDYRVKEDKNRVDGILIATTPKGVEIKMHRPEHYFNDVSTEVDHMDPSKRKYEYIMFSLIKGRQRIGEIHFYNKYGAPNRFARATNGSGIYNGVTAKVSLLNGGSDEIQLDPYSEEFLSPQEAWSKYGEKMTSAVDGLLED